MLNERGFHISMPLMIAIVVIAAGGVYFTFINNTTDDDTNTVLVNNAADNTNTAAAENTNTEVNAAANTSTRVNINTTTQSNTNATTGTPEVSSVTAIENASTYDGQRICITGPYQDSFEFSAFGSKLSYDPDGNLQLDEPYIWLDFALPEQNELDCRTTAVGQQICTGENVRACGTFEYAAPGETGLGHVNAYRYALTNEPAASSNILNIAP